MIKFLYSILLISLSIITYAQKTISGKVLEKDTGTELVGVSVSIKGTTVGTLTDATGKYSIATSKNDAVLVFSFVGYNRQQIAIGNQSIINVSLEIESKMMDEVVVSVLNIQRNKESLGYSITQVSAEKVNEARENNVMNSLSGKVAGLQITQSNTGIDGSSRVLLRGITTISGSNRPLVVIDGIPISNGSGGVGGDGGVDRGDALSDINPDDVASISVLKGTGAAAAYGSLGMNGVILISTKTGSKKKGIGVSISSSFLTTSVALTPNFQNEYGSGAFSSFAPINSDGRPV